MVLEKGMPYLVTMQGTYSAWGGIAAPGSKSGTPEPAPMFPSPQGANKAVGIDPEFTFAWPQGSKQERSPEPAPRRQGAIEISLDGGKTWRHPSSTAPFNATDHKYAYELMGDGNALQVRLLDNPYSDNYGRVQILVMPAKPTAIPLYRHYNVAGVDHLYTTSQSESNTAPGGGWAKEGVCCEVLPTQSPGSIPLYRLYHRSGVNHFYTTNAAEKQNALASLGYADEGIAGYVYPAQ
jgi:hypothetical protein